MAERKPIGKSGSAVTTAGRAGPEFETAV